MKHFKEFIQWCCEPQRLFVLFIVVLAIPNVALFFTEQQMTLLARICNVILPVSVYWLIMTLGVNLERLFGSYFRLFSLRHSNWYCYTCSGVLSLQ